MISDLLPPFPHLTVEQITRSVAVVALCLRSTRESASCPRCQCLSHSSYGWFTRQVQAVSCLGQEVLFVLHGQRFRCRNSACPRRTFREDFAPLACRYQRRTQEVIDVLRQIARELGGQAGARVARQVPLGISATTLLRLVKQAPTPTNPHSWCHLRPV